MTLLKLPMVSSVKVESKNPNTIEVKKIVDFIEGSSLDLEFKPLSANSTKWSNTVKQFVGCCRRIV